MPFYYDPSASYLATALRYTHTVVPCVLARPTFWLFQALHWSIFCAYRNGYFQDADQRDSPLYVEWRIIQIITSMTTFFEVFYTNNVFSRYIKLYNLSRKIFGDLPNFAFNARVFFGSQQQAMVRLSCRYVVSSVVLFFYELSRTVEEDEWDILVTRNLLSAEDVDYLKGCNFEREQNSLIVLHWAGRALGETAVQAGVPATIIKGLIDRLIQMREQQQVIRDTLRLPMPFQYFHVLNMMVVVNLLLWAYGFGVSMSWLSPIGFFFAELIFCGMMELAGQMSDPFGRDEVDFPLNVWFSHALADTGTIIEYQYEDSPPYEWDEAAAKCPPFETRPELFKRLASISQREGPERVGVGDVWISRSSMNTRSSTTASSAEPPKATKTTSKMSWKFCLPVKLASALPQSLGTKQQPESYAPLAQGSVK